MDYQPPYTISPEILNRATAISEARAADRARRPGQGAAAAAHQPHSRPFTTPYPFSWMQALNARIVLFR